MQRRLATILAADVVGSSAKMEADEVGTIRSVGLLQQYLVQTAQPFAGRLFSRAGDGFLFEFSGPTAAVEFAERVQTHLITSEAQDEIGLQLRIGVHIAEAVVDGEDLLGDGVNIACRIEAEAGPGEVWVSAAIRDYAKRATPFEFIAKGEHKLKNISQPMSLYALCGLSDDRAQSPTAQSVATPTPPVRASGKPSIVVLPFENLSGDPDQSYFSDGIADDIITDLSRYDELFVIARQSAFAFHERKLSAFDFATELGVSYLLEGSIRRAANRVRVSVQLVDVATRSTLWAERFNREVEDIFDVQEEIATVTVNTLIGQVSLRHYKQIMMTGADAITAYDHALKAQKYVWEFSRESAERARKEAEAAIRLDPGYARAHAILGWAYHTQGSNNWQTDEDQPFDKALECARNAIAADTNEPWGHCVLGFTLWWREKGRDFAQALEEIKQAVRLNPSNAHFRMIMGATYAYMGQGEDAIREIEDAMRFNPFYPSLYLIHMSRAKFVTGRYEEALADAERAAIEMPRHANVIALLAACYQKLGKTRQASEAMAVLRDTSPDYTLSFVRSALPFARKGDLDLFCELMQAAGLPE